MSVWHTVCFSAVCCTKLVQMLPHKINEWLFDTTIRAGHMIRKTERIVDSALSPALLLFSWMHSGRVHMVRPITRHAPSGPGNFLRRQDSPARSFGLDSNTALLPTRRNSGPIVQKKCGIFVRPGSKLRVIFFYWKPFHQTVKYWSSWPKKHVLGCIRYIKTKKKIGLKKNYWSVGNCPIRQQRQFLSATPSALQEKFPGLKGTQEWGFFTPILNFVSYALILRFCENLWALLRGGAKLKTNHIWPLYIC
jgi:hypothetical protein